jgi:histidinol-phosphatase (PHP family)
MDVNDPDGSEGLAKRDISKYLADIEFTRRNFPLLSIGLGIEAGVNKENLERTEKILFSYAFDQIILSVHNVGQISVAKPPKGTKYSQFLKAYLEEVLYCVVNMKQYQVLGHLDYPARYLPLTVENYMELTELVDAILAILISRGKALELNTAKLDTPKHYKIMQWILKRYVKMGGYLITVGSDAHHLEAIARNYLLAEELLTDTEFDSVVVFKDTVTTSVPIQN